MRQINLVEGKVVAPEGMKVGIVASMIIPKLIDGTWKKVLFVPTGALMSKTSFNEGENVAGIAHAIFLEGVR